MGMLGYENMRLLEEGITACIGNTPLVRLTRAVSGGFQLFAKMEGMNPGGSLKDRPALEIVRRGKEAGMISAGTVVVEASSGNMGIALAQLCRFLGLRFICVVDTRTTALNLQLLRAYGAEVEVVSTPDAETGELLQARIKRAQQIAAENKNSFWVNQYANAFNAAAHWKTMEEIVSSLGTVDYLFCPASSCGTLRGCADYVRSRDMKSTRIYAVDAVGSVIFGGPKGKRLIPGHGAGLRPALYKADLADKCISVSDLDAVIGCRRLLAREALLAGGSSGATLMAVEQTKHSIPRGANCVAIFPDRGERYLDTIFCDEWVREHFGVSSIDVDVDR